MTPVYTCLLMLYGEARGVKHGRLSTCQVSVITTYTTHTYNTCDFNCQI